MLSLDTRKIRILQTVVIDYVQTTRPVGSERLIELCNLGCKSATIRNEMADLSEMGYLAQPHTSAGRIPTDRGYRYYVDRLMAPPALTPEDTRRIRESCRVLRNEMADLIQQTCRVLSGLTSYASLATDPVTSNTTLRRVYLTEASPRHVLLVVLLSTGHVEHRLVEVDAAPSDSTLIQLSNYLNTLVTDHDLEEIGRRLHAPEIPMQLQSYAPVLGKVTHQ